MYLPTRKPIYRRDVYAKYCVSKYNRKLIIYIGTLTFIHSTLYIEMTREKLNIFTLSLRQIL